MNVGSEIRAQLPICGDCVNCKLVVWSKDAKTAEISGSSNVKLSDEQRYNFTVRCNWLKSTVREPMQLVKCEGKRAYNESDTE